MRDNPARVRISDVLRSERERCATNQLNPRLSSAQASRIKQKSHQGDEQYWKAKNHSATELAVGETFPKRKSFALTQRNWVRSMLLTHSTSKDRNLCFLITVPVMALLLTAFLCSGNPLQCTRTPRCCRRQKTALPRASRRYGDAPRQECCWV